MGHQLTPELLTLFVEGDLDPVRLEAVEGHLANCSECRSWVQTYRLLESALTEEATSDVPHFGSRELALYALSPESLDDVTRRRAALHAGHCATCAEEIQLVRESVAAADRSAGEQRGATAWLRSTAGWAAAAGVALVVGALLLWQSPSPSSSVLISGEKMAGKQRIDARRSILIENTEVSRGAELTLESERLAFGDGFSVGNDASLIAGRGAGG